jgi:cytochrome c553/uncharacterized protein (DUF302 family)
MKRLVLLVLFAFPLVVDAYDKETAVLIFKKCALCHSHYGQGIPGGRYPRLSGMDEEYMVQALKDFKEGKRWDTAMSVISGLPEMSEADMEAVAKYIASINLDEYDPYFDVAKLGTGDLAKGEELFQDECKTCHGKRGEGKPRKGAPFLKGQYTEYMVRQIGQFKKKERYHDRDPEDEAFEEYTDAELNDILAYVASLDDKEKPAPKATADIMKEKAERGDHVFGISQTVLKMPLEEGVSAEDARQAMLSKAAEVNLKMVGNQMVHKELQARGIDAGILEIYQFCDPEDAMKMVQYNPLYAAYMPCRIALVEDADKRLWVTMINLDFLIENVPLPQDLRTIAININGKMLDIISAAATGEF